MSTKYSVIVRGRMIGGLSHTLHEGSGKMIGLMVETPHSLGSASTELRSRVEAPGDASGDAAGTPYLTSSSIWKSDR